MDFAPIEVAASGSRVMLAPGERAVFHSSKVVVGVDVPGVGRFQRQYVAEPASDVVIIASSEEIISGGTGFLQPES